MHRALALSLLLLSACAGGSSAARPDGPGAPAAGPRRNAAGEIVAEVDLNGDGKPDLWRTTRRADDGRELLVRVERDLNGDGKIDLWQEFGPDGQLVEERFDFDFDGRVDERVIYEKGQIVRKELAFGFDGKPGAWVYYEKGRRVRRERDLNRDGKVDYWEYWEGDEIDRIGIDLDGDGTVDRWENRRGSGAPAAAQPSPAAQPPPAAPKR
jgi:hypothetical protein